MYVILGVVLGLVLGGGGEQCATAPRRARRSAALIGIVAQRMLAPRAAPADDRFEQAERRIDHIYRALEHIHYRLEEIERRVGSAPRPMADDEAGRRPQPVAVCRRARLVPPSAPRAAGTGGHAACGNDRVSGRRTCRRSRNVRRRPARRAPAAAAAARERAGRVAALAVRRQHDGARGRRRALLRRRVPRQVRDRDVHRADRAAPRRHRARRHRPARPRLAPAACARRATASRLQGGGVGVLYLTVFAAFRLYGVLPAPLAFALLLGLVAASGVLAVRQESLALAMLGAAGGFLAPVLASTGQGSHVDAVRLLRAAERRHPRHRLDARVAAAQSPRLRVHLRDRGAVGRALLPAGALRHHRAVPRPVLPDVRGDRGALRDAPVASN